MDGRLLAIAREEKENIRRQAIMTDRRRHETAYARVPELQRLDNRIAAIIPEAAASAMGQGRPIEELKRESLELQARRAELLVENGWPMDWLDGAWDCPKCRDAGFVHGEMCSCLKTLYDKALAQDLSALLKLGSESFETFELKWYDSARAPGAGISPRAQMETVLGLCKDYAYDFKRCKDSLLFRGSTGQGKTFLSACIAREVARQGYSVVYETAVDALGAFEDEKFSRDEQAAAEAGSLVRRILQCDLMILDDLGTEMTTEFARSALYTIVNTRLNTKKKTIISTNLTFPQMKKRYSAQIMSRLEGEYQSVTFAGEDIRRLKSQRGQR